MIQIDVPSPALRPSERDLSMPYPPDVRPSIYLAHPVAAGKVTAIAPDVDKWWGVRFARDEVKDKAEGPTACGHPSLFAANIMIGWPDT
jgi:hypothetical protein